MAGLAFIVNGLFPNQLNYYELDVFYVFGIPVLLYPLCNSLMTLFIVKPYRQFLFQRIRKVRSVFGGGVSSAQTTVVLKGSLSINRK